MRRVLIAIGCLLAMLLVDAHPVHAQKGGAARSGSKAPAAPRRPQIHLPQRSPVDPVFRGPADGSLLGTIPWFGKTPSQKKINLLLEDVKSDKSLFKSQLDEETVKRLERFAQSRPDPNSPPREAWDTVAPKASSSTKIFAAVPWDKVQYERVFERKASDEGVARRMAAVRSSIRSVNKEALFAPGYDHGNSALATFVSDGHPGYGIIIGHNRDGLLRQPNGERVSLDRIADEFAYKGKIGIFLSCESDQYVDATKGQFGVSRRLTFDEASCVAKAIVPTMDAAFDRSFDRIEVMLREAVESCLSVYAHIGLGRKGTVAAGVGVVGLAILVGYMVYGDDRTKGGRSKDDP